MGSGFRTFAASEVLTSSNVQNYLMDQAVTVHSGTAVLATAIPSPEAGMVAYVDSGDSSEGLYTFNGSVWRKGPGWNAPWGVISQTISTTGGATYSSTSYSNITSATPTLLQNRLYRFSYQAMFDNPSGGCIGVVRFYNNTTSTIIQQGNYTLASTAFTVVNLSLYLAPTSTTTPTIYVQAAVAVGGTTFRSYNAATTPMHFVIEDMGPTGAPV